MLTTRTKIALAATLQQMITAVPGLAKRDAQVVVNRSGIRWSLDLNEGIDFSIWLLGAFERRTVAAYSRLVKPGDTVIDIGANIGAHTLFLSRLVGPQGRVVAVEPTAWAVQCLRRNLDLNPELARVVDVQQALLAATSGGPVPAEIYASWPLHGRDVHPKLRARPKSTSGAEAMTLDQLVQQKGIGRVDFIKLDVDGQEVAILNGGMETLRRDHPTIIFELSPYILAEAGDDAISLLSHLHDLGYRLYDLGLRRALSSDFAAVANKIPDGGGINVIAMPTA